MFRSSHLFSRQTSSACLLIVFCVTPSHSGSSRGRTRMLSPKAFKITLKSPERSPLRLESSKCLPLNLIATLLRRRFEATAYTEALIDGHLENTGKPASSRVLWRLQAGWRQQQCIHDSLRFIFKYCRLMYVFGASSICHTSWV